MKSSYDNEIQSAQIYEQNINIDQARDDKVSPLFHLKEKRKSDYSYENETQSAQIYEENTKIDHARNNTVSPGLRLIDLIQKQLWTTVLEVLASKDRDHKQKSFFDRFPITPLHLACSSPKVPVDVIHAIIKQYTNACLTEDEDGNLPIHVACSTPGMDLQVIRTLMIASPKSCLIKENNDGNLPIYLLIEKNGSSDVLSFVSSLISILPASCIYDATKSLVSEIYYDILPEAIIHQILQMYPQVCQIQQNNGDTLLHILCSHKNSTPRIIRMIVNLYPELCAKQDNEGNLPLHLVNSTSYPEEIILILIKGYPHGLFVSNMLGQIPLSAPFIRDPPSKVYTVLKYSDHSDVGHLRK